MTTRHSGQYQELASAYVLGTLSAARRRDVEQAMASDPAMRAAVAEWEERLLPLTRLVEPVTPSADLWARIDSRIDSRIAAAAASAPAPAASGRDTRGAARGSWFGGWWNNLALWRTLAGGGLAAALVMALMPGLRSDAPAAPQYMVVLAAPQNMAPGWLIQARDARHIRLLPLGPSAVPQQKSFQLWTKGEGWKGPVSLGLVTPGQALEVSLDKLPPLQPNQLFEITLEPYNGSPLDRPTGPILFIGRAVKAI